VYVCLVLRKKQPLLPCTTLTDWFSVTKVESHTVRLPTDAHLLTLGLKFT